MKNKLIILTACALALASCSKPEEETTLPSSKGNPAFVFDYNKKQQTMHSFGASDCWRTKFVGVWPDEKRNAIADLLFSRELDEKGSPKGIGLSMWRVNIGAGSSDAPDGAGVIYDWRKEQCYLDKDGNWDWNKNAGSRWMLQAARDRGLEYSLGFSLSAPYFMTKNGKAIASNNDAYCNLKPDKYGEFAEFLSEVCNKLQFDYLSPINEPQWNWTNPAQEGMQATNQEVAKLCVELDKSLERRNAKTMVVFGEAGSIDYLYMKNTNAPMRDNQIVEMFAPNGIHNISNLKHVAPIVSGHSYWTTWPLDQMISKRKMLRQTIQTVLSPEFSYWQTEYNPMESNEDNPQGGNGRDLSINTALYNARVIHYDLTCANAASWQWWTAFSEWNYKDALVYIDDGISVNGASAYSNPLLETCKTDGVFRESKNLWTLGNFSRFIRPGMIRLGSVYGKDGGIKDNPKSLMASAYVDDASKKLVVVVINYGLTQKPIKLEFRGLPEGFDSEHYKMYVTSSSCDLEFKGETDNEVMIPSRSVVTFVSE